MTNGQIAILIAKSQTAVEEHLNQAGLKPVWRLGEPTKSYPDGEPMDDGKIEGKNASIVRIRSAEIPWQVSRGRDDQGNGFDIGLVGTDCFVDHPLENMYVKGAFLYGRGINGNQPQSAIFSKSGSPIKTLDDLRSEKVYALMTERPHMHQSFLDSEGIPSVIYGHEEAAELDYETFAKNAQDKGMVPIKIIEGAGAQQLVRDNDLLGMVRETGRRERNYGLNEIVTVCPIETLLLVNVRSYEDKAKRPGIDAAVADLGRIAVPMETEGTLKHQESLLRGGAER